MQDHAVVAAVIAGDADGFAAAYGQYAASLYASCHAVLPEPEAAEAVLDTFLVAATRLDGLRDTDRFGPWLHAVARNECLRRLGPGAEIPADQDAEPPELPLPPGFRGRVLTACADSSPAGRARRMSAAHRAGVFGAAGFPKAIGPSGPSWWRRVRRHPGTVAAMAVVAALAMTAGITVAMTAGASHRPQASGSGLGAGLPAPAPGTTPGATAGTPSPARTAPASARPTASAAVPSAVPASATSAGPSPRRSTPAPSVTPSASLSPSPSVSPSVSPSTSPAQGHLLVAPAKLALTSVSGKTTSGTFVLTAAGGPVSHYTVQVAATPAGVKVSPADGSLRVNGTVTVTVTVTSKVALTTDVIVGPGKLTVTVVYKLKPKPKPSPSPSPK
jgi:Sigma-70 region 2